MTVYATVMDYQTISVQRQELPLGDDPKECERLRAQIALLWAKATEELRADSRIEHQRTEAESAVAAVAQECREMEQRCVACEEETVEHSAILNRMAERVAQFRVPHKGVGERLSQEISRLHQLEFETGQQLAALQAPTPSFALLTSQVASAVQWRTKMRDEAEAATKRLSVVQLAFESERDTFEREFQAFQVSVRTSAVTFSLALNDCATRDAKVDQLCRDAGRRHSSWSKMVCRLRQRVKEVQAGVDHTASAVQSRSRFLADMVKYTDSLLADVAQAKVQVENTAVRKTLCCLVFACLLCLSCALSD